ncbi:MAG: bifunctional [glutamate--ammonia ligase]-adenylyl-L-tyrosine phosphorylase/[glutamate--ammonia-ligase] adenylyltransferase [Betaproteobacteria bacterium]|nr:bifunctional [glutamate--ammonia ligase]-adenylyl-L-tyrosine phosphorylase/[glutamate--ammonia-ligase] adenylyltransferase [Betaproteobacteria bacterium]
MESNNAGAIACADPALHVARGFSRLARRLLEAEPQLAAAAGCDRPFDSAEMRTFLAQQSVADEAALRRALRILRKRVMLRLIARDLDGRADLDEVLATTTALAQTAIAVALTWLDARLSEQHGQPRCAESGGIQQLHVVGMGKLGGGELNVSSDVDLIFTYPEEGETDGAKPLSNHEYFTRLARRLIAALNETTEDGHVFRVDMRLRPYGDSGPLVASFDMLENYLITQGREWERYAWIKGRPLTGDRGAEMMELVRPFVYRRHLDYSAFASMRDLHRQIRREVERRELFDNIKLGPGGIREIEFIAQVFQLIRGGRDPELRRQPTLEVLPLLAVRNLLPAPAVEELTGAYVFLRNLEHRLQYLDDQQTHEPPKSADDRLAVARSMRFVDYAALSAELERHRAHVTRQFDAIFAAAPPDQHALAGLWQEAGDPEENIAQLASLGYRRPLELQHRLGAMRASPRYRQMPAASQLRLDRLVPLAIETAVRASDPDTTLERILALFESISRRESYLALIEEYPQALARLADLVGASQWVAQYLTQHPILLDELLDTRTLYAAPDWPASVATLHAQLDDAAADTERQMNILRHFKHAHTMRLIAQDLSGTLPLETLSDHLSDLACVILEEVLRVAWNELRSRHRADPKFAVIGYGKLGGKELGYASDLDLVFLYDDAAAEAPENYARLAQRINAWLTSITPAGVLYDTDLRLRPEGVSGLLVSPLESYREYQMKHAWVWEHQALTRARFAAGDKAIGREFEAVRIAILRQPRELGELKREIVAMRKKIHDAHPNPTPLFDLKHDRGGIIEVEFIVQYLVLGYAHAHPELTGNIGNLALLKLAARLGLVGEPLAQAAHDAYRRFRQLQHGLRLQGETYARIDPAAAADSRRAVVQLWEEVMGEG